MSEVTKVLSEDEARKLTEEVKADAVALWAKLLRLHDGNAHRALGYSSWGAYYEAEFGQGAARGYQLLRAARVVEVFDSVPEYTKPTELQARELVSLIPKGSRAGPPKPPTPEQEEIVRETWRTVVEEHGPEPAPRQIRETVRGNGAKPAKLRAVPDPEPAPPAHYLPDLVHEDAGSNLRTQAVHWYEQGRRVQRLLDKEETVRLRSKEDRAALRRDADLMVRVARRLKEAIRNAE